MKQFNGLVVADLDGTFRDGSLFAEVFVATVHAGLFSKEIKEQVSSVIELYQTGQITFPVYEMKLFQAYYSGLKGVDHLQYAKIAQRVVAQDCKKKIFEYTYKLLNEKRNQDWCVFFNSASVDDEVNFFCRAWQFDFCCGSLPQVGEDGLCTGNNVSNIKDQKVVKVKALLKKKRLAGVNKNIIVIGDSRVDYEMMKYIFGLGGRVICFNPRKELLEIAHDDWEIVTGNRDFLK